MRTRSRSLRLVTFGSLTLMLASPAIAADARGGPAGAAATKQFCIYQDGHTDTPETGPMPCDTSRRYMIGTSELGSPRIPADTEFSTGPRSHLGAPPSAATGSIENSGPSEGTMASPPEPGSNGDRGIDVEAP
jgi:hypothetical protein